VSTQGFGLIFIVEGNVQGRVGGGEVWGFGRVGLWRWSPGGWGLEHGAIASKNQTGTFSEWHGLWNDAKTGQTMVIPNGY
jgi:hypothetical protein